MKECVLALVFELSCVVLFLRMSHFDALILKVFQSGDILEIEIGRFLVFCCCCFNFGICVSFRVVSGVHV